MTLQALREKVGDATFFRILRDWFAQHRYGNVDTADFIALAERDSHRNLHRFFDLWLFTPGQEVTASAARRGATSRAGAHAAAPPPPRRASVRRRVNDGGVQPPAYPPKRRVPSWPLISVQQRPFHPGQESWRGFPQERWCCQALVFARQSSRQGVVGRQAAAAQPGRGERESLARREVQPAARAPRPRRTAAAPTAR